MNMELLPEGFKTDYFGTWERNQGLAWCYVHQNFWHILLPHPPNGPWPKIMQARPVSSDRKGDPLVPADEVTTVRRWRWRLEVGAWHVALRQHSFQPFMPPLIDEYSCQRRHAVCYCSAKPDGIFARVAYSCPLLLVRDDQGALPPPRDWRAWRRSRR